MNGEENHLIFKIFLILVFHFLSLLASHHACNRNQLTKQQLLRILFRPISCYIKVIMSNPIDNNNNASFEDRHFLSDPRPIPSLELATWDVDILRQGVDTPIMTIRVDEVVLPPRKNKKKTIWKLPDSIETIPKFGTQDKRRIFDLFREKKKELKKLKNKQRAYRRASTIEAMSGGDESISCGNDFSENVGDNSDDESSTNTTKKDPYPPRNGSKGPSKETSIDDNSELHNAHRRSEITIKDGSISDSGAPPPPGFGSLSISEPVYDERRNGLENKAPTTTSLPSHPPPPPPPPPGLLPHAKQQSPNSTAAINGHNHQQNSHSAPSSSTPPPPPGLQQNGQHHQHNRQSSPTPPQYHRQYSPPPRPPPTVGPCFILPPNAPTGSTLGKYVTESYYMLLRNSLIRELDAYYYNPSKDDSNSNNDNETAVATTNTVYKAVMVGGAHAVCATQQDRLMQLQTFAGIEMRIKGVQQQPTTGDGVLILITGVSIRVATTTGTAADTNGQQQQQQKQIILPFCHTLILAPVLTTVAASTIPNNDTATNTYTTKIGYQILNDNLVILTGDD